MREHGTAMAIIALFLVLAFGAAGIIVFSDGAEDAPVLGSSGSGGTPGPDNPLDCPRAEPEGFALADVEGQSLPQVESWAAARDWTVRPVMIDGQPQAVTMDLRPDRVNVQTEADVVTRYCGNY